ncbi:MAG: carbohydrate ABC transporter permease [Acetanaerobacterium sp.]
MKTMKKMLSSGVLYVVPALLVIALVMLYPLLYTFMTGFQESTLFMDKPIFSGFDQYVKLFADKIFLLTIKNTLVWTFFSVLFQFAIGFAAALAVHQHFVKGKPILRILLMIPWVLPSVIGASVWQWMYHPDFGLINYILESVGLIDGKVSWLSSVDTALAAVIVVNVWKMFPFVMLMLEAALQSVSKELKEAATIDGAGRFRTFMTVTIPAISTTCFTVILLMTIWTLNAFTFIFTLTAGGPAHQTEVMSMYIYKTTFQNYDFGMASAASTVLFLLSIVISIAYFTLFKKEEEL